MAKSRFSTGLVATSLVIVGLGAAAWFYFRQGNDKAPQLTTVTISKGELTQVVTASGGLQPVTSVDVSSQVSGLIKEVFVDYNTPVKEGDVLARIDAATYEQKLKSAEADLASTKASAMLTRATTNRTRELFKRNLVTQQELDQAEAELAQSEAQLLIRSASVEDAKVNLARCTIYAPIDGIVMQRATEVGKTVAASLNAPTLFVIANKLDQMEISAAVAEADIGNVLEGQEVNFTVDAFPNRQFHGKVTQIRNSPITTQNVVTYETIISVTNDDLKLKPGMTANVSIVVAQHRDVLRIPNSALRARVPEELLVQKQVAETKGEKKAAESAKPVSEEDRRRIMREIFREVGFSRDAGAPSPEMIQKIQQLAKEKGIDWDPSRFGGRGGGSGNKNNSLQPVSTRTVFKLVSSDPEAPKIEAVTIKLGISDSIVTEVLEGLQEGDVLVTSVSSANSPAGAPGAANPFAGGQRGMGGMGGRR